LASSGRLLAAIFRNLINFFKLKLKIKWLQRNQLRKQKQLRSLPKKARNSFPSNLLSQQKEVAFLKN
jgi:hypothetical protein